jgi:Ca-activated chloride channel family protein
MSIRLLIRLLVVAIVAAGAVAVAAQQATFKGAVRTVAVYATVTEPGGRLVPDLSRDDFMVDDNGAPQDLTVFANDLQPITVVMMIDRSGSMRSQFELVEQAAEQFVRELRPGDKARIGSFSNRIQVDPRTFTSDTDELLSILRREMQEEGPTPLWNAVNVGITALLHEEGRRVILVFTDGMDEPLNPGPNSSTLRDVMKRAEAEDVMVYAIGLAGTSAPQRVVGGPGRGRGGWGGGGGYGGGPYGRGGGWGRGRPTSGVPGRVDPGLAKIAEATGGGYFELTTTADLGATFRRVAEELHHQYLLGFSPKVLDGKTHRLDVRVKGAGLSVRARRTYLAMRE